MVEQNLILIHPFTIDLCCSPPVWKTHWQFGLKGEHNTKESKAS